LTRRSPNTGWIAISFSRRSTLALAAVQTDALINVTPPQFHRDVSIRALEAGIPVLSEKPLAPTPAEAQRLWMPPIDGRFARRHAELPLFHVAQTLKKALDPSVMGAIGALTVEFSRGRILVASANRCLIR